MLYFGLSPYLVWISAATVISTALLANGWGVRLPEAIATEEVFLLGAIGIWMNMNRNLFYGATVFWALIAVDVEQPDYLIIRYAARGTAGALAIIIGLHLVNGRPVF